MYKYFWGFWIVGCVLIGCGSKKMDMRQVNDEHTVDPAIFRGEFTKTFFEKYKISRIVCCTATGEEECDSLMEYRFENSTLVSVLYGTEPLEEGEITRTSFNKDGQPDIDSVFSYTGSLQYYRKHYYKKGKEERVENIDGGNVSVFSYDYKEDTVFFYIGKQGDPGKSLVSALVKGKDRNKIFLPDNQKRIFLTMENIFSADGRLNESISYGADGKELSRTKYHYENGLPVKEEQWMTNGLLYITTYHYTFKK